MDKATQQLISLFYAWNDYEKKNEIEIVDFDLIQARNKVPRLKIGSREEVFKALNGIYKQLPSRSAEQRFIKAKANASLYLLKSLMGEKIEFHQYVQNTMGVKPKIFPEGEIKSQQEKVQTLLRRLGYGKTLKELRRFNKENRLNKREIRSNFLKFKDAYLPRFLKWLNLDIHLNFRPKFVSVDKYWRNWVSTDEKGTFLLRYNLHPRHIWIKGVTEIQVLHEVCAHLAQLASWKRQIKLGKMNPFIGLTTIFTPEEFILEGIAEALIFFLPKNPLSLYGQAALAQDHLNWLVWNNFHIWANKGKGREEIINYVHKYLPLKKTETIKYDLKKCTKNPLLRAYQYIYGIAFYHHKKIAAKLDKEERRSYILKIFKNAFTARQILTDCF